MTLWEMAENGGDTAKRLGNRTSQEPQAGWLISFSPGTAGSSQCMVMWHL